jgi:hypothetical protein
MVGRRRKSRVVPNFMGIIGFEVNWLGFVFFLLFCKAALVLEPVRNTLITPVKNRRDRVRLGRVRSQK